MQDSPGQIVRIRGAVGQWDFKFLFYLSFLQIVSVACVQHARRFPIVRV